MKFLGNIFSRISRFINEILIIQILLQKNITVISAEMILTKMCSLILFSFLPSNCSWSSLRNCLTYSQHSCSDFNNPQKLLRKIILHLSSSYFIKCFDFDYMCWIFFAGIIPQICLDIILIFFLMMTSKKFSKNNIFPHDAFQKLFKNPLGVI